MSRRAKEAFKTALAMTMAYGLALWLGWDKPSWAAIAVAAISLSSIGQSLNKAGFRMAGTVVAGLAALTILALFPQQRWLFALVLFAWLAFCTYQMIGSTRPYFWHVCGFVTAVVCGGSAGNTDGAFNIAILRLQETGLGILVYSLVSILVWPVSSGDDLKATLAALLSSQRAFAKALLADQLKPDNAAELLGQMSQQRQQLNVLLAAARTDSFAVESSAAQWAQIVGASAGIVDALRRLEDAALDLQDQAHLGLTSTEDVAQTLEQRFVAAGRLLDGDTVEVAPDSLPSMTMREGLHLNHYEVAAVTVAAERLNNLVTSVDRLIHALTALRDGIETDRPSAARTVFPDPDQLLAALRVMGCCWLVYLLWINIEGLPGGVTNITFVAVFSIAVASMPQLPLGKILQPALAAILLASLIAFGVMTQLDGFLQLGALIFAFTFFICYHFHEPAQALGRMFGLAMFAVIANISNEQSYSFLASVNTALMFPVVLTAIWVSGVLPLSQQPVDVYSRLLRRYFRSVAYLTDTPIANNLYHRWRLRYSRQQIATLPGKLAAWSAPAAAQSGMAPGALQAVQQALLRLSDHLLELHDFSSLDRKQIDESGLRVWRNAINTVATALMRDQQGQQLADPRNQLSRMVAELEEQLDEVMRRLPDPQTELQMYRLVGGYRGVAESLLRYLDSANAIDRNTWRMRRYP